MINVVVKGKRRFRATCSRCLCVFEYDLSDLVKYISCEYAKCPCCKNDVVHMPSSEDVITEHKYTEEKE